MTVLPQNTQRLIRNRGMAALYGIAAEHDCDLSDVLDILVTAPFTPSQPGDTSRSHAPVAQADEGAVPPSSTSSSVDLSGLAAHEQGPIPSPAVPPVDDATDGRTETLLSEPSVAPKSKRVYGRQEQVISIHREHPDWPDTVIAKHLGVHDAYVRTTATRLGLILPSRRDYDEAQKAKTTEALKASPAKPQEAVEPKAQPEPEQPSASKPVDHKPLPAATSPNEPRRVVPTHAPVGAGSSTRFYVRDDRGRYLHQSLERSPTDTGPLMTINRKWAWFDNAQRFAGACRKWPEIADMRKEFPNAR